MDFLLKPVVMDNDINLSPSKRLRMSVDIGAAVVSKLKGQIPIDMSDFYNAALPVGVIPSPHEALGSGIFPNPLAYREYLHWAHMCGRWATSGFNLFNLTHDLASALLLTEPAAASEALRLPFTTFAIQIPPGVVPFFTEHGQYWADLIWVYEFISYRIKSPTNTPGGFAEIEIRGDESWQRSADGIDPNSTKEPFLRYSVHCKGMQLWRDRNPLTLDDPDENVWYGLWETDPKPVPQDQITLNHALRIIKNLLTWLDFTGGLKRENKRTISKKHRKRVAKGDDTAKWPCTWILGNEVKLSKELRDRVPDIALGGSKHAPKDWKMRVRYIVRGHWKMQAHGPGRTLRMRKWIEPYWKGSSDLPVWAHTYTTKDE